VTVLGVALFVPAGVAELLLIVVVFARRIGPIARSRWGCPVLKCEPVAGLLDAMAPGMFGETTPGRFGEAPSGAVIGAAAGLFVEAMPGLFVEAAPGLFIEAAPGLFNESPAIKRCAVVAGDLAP